MGRLTDLAGGDYSQPRTVGPAFRPHDLVHITPAALTPDAPAWAQAVVARGEPVVVRRGHRDATTLPVGVRGASRDRRFAARVSPSGLRGDPVTPESLVDGPDPARDARIPALAVLPALRAAMAPWSGAWGIGGAVGYELACGAAACHAQSDVDLILRVGRTPVPAALRALAERLATLPVRCDVQLETPAGGVALADWLSAPPQVLVKSDQGPYLAADPWALMAGCTS
ncbi:malonate decarboxylase holo-ACP synthase [Salinisphaera sp. RV14]|uniref:malonate decarboxylase holo-ACP synthase n=1 Tax=Salinisphaera sp. RV14 TaxID=3454140 RepID=UPI003F863F00